MFFMQKYFRCIAIGLQIYGFVLYPEYGHVQIYLCNRKCLYPGNRLSSTFLVKVVTVTFDYQSYAVNGSSLFFMHALELPG